MNWKMRFVAVGVVSVISVLPLAAKSVGGTLSANARWSIADSPIDVTNSLTVASSAVLTIDPGVIVRVANAASITVAGRLVAAGDATNRIQFTGTNWSGVRFTATRQDNQIRGCEMDSIANGGTYISLNASTLLIESCNWSNKPITCTVISESSSSLVVKNCTFPTLVQSRMIDFVGIAANGTILIDGNTFGSSTCYNDILHINDIYRPNGVCQVMNNIFEGSGDDIVDINGSDVYVEGNIFYNARRDPNCNATTANAVSPGINAGQTHYPNVTMVRNIFINNDNSVLVKDKSFLDAQNNTFIGSKIDTFSLDEPGHATYPGRGEYIDGCIFYSNRIAFTYVTGANTPIVNRSIIQGTNTAFGIGNIDADPRFVDASNINAPKSGFRLRADSPGIGTGPNGLDMGAIVPAGASISGEPISPTINTNVTLVIGGPGIVNHLIDPNGKPVVTNYYRFKTNNGAWSTDIEISQPLLLTNLSDGTYTVYVVGRNSAGVWQNTNAATASKTWVVNSFLDSDGDGIPDRWEIEHGFNPHDASDAALDADQDGATNFQEYVSGTDPHDATSFLRIEAHAPNPGAFQVQFYGLTGKHYIILFRDHLESGEWITLKDLDPLSTSGVTTVPDATGQPQRFYRLVVLPMQ